MFIVSLLTHHCTRGSKNAQRSICDMCNCVSKFTMNVKLFCFWLWIKCIKFLGLCFYYRSDFVFRLELVITIRFYVESKSKNMLSFFLLLNFFVRCCGAHTRFRIEGSFRFLNPSINRFVILITPFLNL